MRASDLAFHGSHYSITLVKSKRAELGLDGDDGKRGRAIEFPTIEPWPEVVDGAELLDEIAGVVRRHVVLTDYSRDAVALWIVHTYLIDRFLISPKLTIRSATKGCGKSTLLDTLARLVARPMQAASITAAAIFRTIEAFHPTLLIDECDSFVSQDDALRGVLNASHRADGAVIRTTGEDFEPRSFRVYSAVALAGIGSLAATLVDRSIIIDLQRRLSGEPIEQLRVGQTGHFDDIARRIVRWVADHGERVGQIVPVMPRELFNRQADNWLPLLSIGDAAGGPWAKRASGCGNGDASPPCGRRR
jgi:putative DNA primase/helicase